MSEETPLTVPVTLIRLPAVIRLTGRSRTSIYDDMKLGTFPKAVKIGVSAVAWRLSEVMAWIESRVHYDDAA